MATADVLLASPARQRMTVLAISAACFAVSNSAFDMITPLWATGDIGYRAADWAHLRSLRFTGTGDPREEEAARHGAYRASTTT